MDAVQRASMLRDGYLVIPDAVPPAVLQEANRLYDIQLANNLGTKQVGVACCCSTVVCCALGGWSAACHCSCSCPLHAAALLTCLLP
eukprot:COSAG01_NODE_18789_length_1053_cov_1.023061_2_plen_87_part_00